MGGLPEDGVLYQPRGVGGGAHRGVAVGPSQTVRARAWEMCQMRPCICGALCELPAHQKQVSLSIMLGEAAGAAVASGTLVNSVAVSIRGGPCSGLSSAEI